MWIHGSERLALAGGEPVYRETWPRWPRADRGTELTVLEALHSGRWAISGCSTGTRPFERRFAAAFAAYHGLPYCVPTASGSSALSIALEALGVRRGDEVLVPGLTWVACASSVAAMGAIPVLVDVEPGTLCMSVEAARAAMTRRTAAIMVVHLYCSAADLDGFTALSGDSGIPLLEDCSQAHGAVWCGRRVGTFGRVGAFSMQHSKVLTCGEGGAAITADERLYDLMQQLRADGRRYSRGPVRPGEMELEEAGDIQGRNRCLSELQAAVLLDRLTVLEEENRLRERNGELLGRLLEELGVARLLVRPPQLTARTYYHFCVRLSRDAFPDESSQAVARALTAELGVLAEPVDPPLNRNVLYNPLRSPRTALPDREQLDPGRFHLPEAERAHLECLTLPHPVLLSEEPAIYKVAEAFGKIARLRRQLPAEAVHA